MKITDLRQQTEKSADNLTKDFLNIGNSAHGIDEAYLMAKDKLLKNRLLIDDGIEWIPLKFAIYVVCKEWEESCNQLIKIRYSASQEVEKARQEMKDKMFELLDNFFKSLKP